MTDQTNNLLTEQGFSVIRFFDLFRKEIQKTNVFPLSEQNLVIHKDNYAALGDELEDYAFAHIGLDHPTSNMTLTFALDFFQQGVVFYFGQFDEVSLDCDQIGDNEEEVAKKLFNVLAAIANGTIFLLLTVTEDDENVQAMEIVYKTRGKTEVLLTLPAFASARKLKNRQLEVVTHRNDYDIPSHKVDKSLLFQLLPYDDAFLANRTLTQGIAPLTREEWSANYEQMSNERIDAAFERFETKLGLSEGLNKKSQQSFFGQYQSSLKWRHISMAAYFSVLTLLLAIARDLAPYVAAVGLIALLYAAFLFIIRHKKPYRLLRLLAYLIGGAGLYYLLSTHPGGVIATIVTVLSIYELTECIVVDVYRLLKRRWSVR